MAVLTILRATPPLNEWGDRNQNEVEHLLRGCIVAPRGSSETNADYNNAVIVGLTVYAPHSAVLALPEGVVRPDDRAVYRDKTYQVEGEPEEWVNPFTGRARGWQISLTRTDG